MCRCIVSGCQTSLPSPCHVLFSPEYVDNLKDEGHVCGIIDRLLDYLENKGSTEEICRIYLRRIMHTYYKFDYKAHRRSLGLQGESKVRKTQERVQEIELSFFSSQTRTHLQYDNAKVSKSKM